jgi:hypothetical protein
MEAASEVPAWFAELDQLDPEPFMEVRAQPDAPVRRVFE